MRFTVAIAGLGSRGKIHLDSFLANPDRFDIAAVCDINPEALKIGGEMAKLPESALYTDAEKMLAETNPDVFCFSTLPDIRLEFVKLAAKYKVTGLIFEKPMATSIQEAREIARICEENNIKAVVSHQQKYLDSMQELKKTIDSGSLGAICRIHSEAFCNSSVIGTHFIDYALWAAGETSAEWCAGHIHGREELASHHPSPDFVYGLTKLKSGVRVYFEFGYLKKQYIFTNEIWVDNRLTVYGENGYAWADTDGGFKAQFDGRSAVTKQFKHWRDMERFGLQNPFAKDFADWLDGKIEKHSCAVDIAAHGFEILQALYIAGIENRRVDLPLTEKEMYDALERMQDKEILPEISTYSTREKYV